MLHYLVSHVDEHFLLCD